MKLNMKKILKKFIQFLWLLISPCDTFHLSYLRASNAILSSYSVCKRQNSNYFEPAKNRIYILRSSPVSVLSSLSGADEISINFEYSSLCPAIEKQRGDTKNRKGKEVSSIPEKNHKKENHTENDKRRLEQYLREALSRGHSGAAVKALRLLHSDNFTSSSHSIILSTQLYCEVIGACLEKKTWEAALQTFSLYSSAVGKKNVDHTLVAQLARGLAECSQIEKAVALVKSFLTAPTKLTEREFSVILSCCANSGRTDLVDEVCLVMKDLGINWGPLTYALRVKGFGRAHPPDASKIDQVLQQMRSSGVRPDLVLMNSVVDAYVRCNQLRKAQKVLEAMHKSSLSEAQVRPTARTYNTLIKGLGLQGNLKSAFGLVAVMEKENIPVNEVTRNTLVHACVKANRFHDAYQLLTRHHSAHNGTDSTGGVEAYTALLNGYGKRGERAKAMLVLQLMLKRGVKPNLVTYTALIDAYMRAGDCNGARSLLDFLTDKGKSEPEFIPGVVTYNCYFTGLCRIPSDKNIAEAMALFKKMLRQGIRADETTYNILIRGLLSFESPRILEAETMFRGMKRMQVSPTKVTFSILMKAYSSVGQLQKVHALWNEMILSEKSTPDTIALNSYISACIKNGALKEAISIFERSQTNKTQLIRPNLISYSTLIVALARSTNTNQFAGSKAVSLYREMRTKYQLEPDAFLVDKILDACCHSRSRRGSAGLNLDFGREVLDDLEALGWSDEEVQCRRALLLSFVPTLSEVWKEQKELGCPTKKKKVENMEGSVIPSAVDNIFAKHGWNKIDSGFNALF